MDELLKLYAVEAQRAEFHEELRQNYKVYGINPTTGIRELWHDTETAYGAEVAHDAALECGWTQVETKFE